MLLKANTQKDLLSKKVVIVQNLLDETNATLQNRNASLKKSLNDYKGKVIVLSDQLTEANKTVQHKDKELLKSLKAKKWFVISDNAKEGGIAEMLSEFINEQHLEVEIYSFELSLSQVIHRNIRSYITSPV